MNRFGCLLEAGNLVESLQPDPILLAGSGGLGAVYAFADSDNDLFFLYFAVHILRDVAWVIGQCTLRGSRLAINTPRFKGNSDFGDRC